MIRFHLTSSILVRVGTCPCGRMYDPSAIFSQSLLCRHASLCSVCCWFSARSTFFMCVVSCSRGGVFLFLVAMAVLCKGLEVCVTPRLSLFAAISARSDVV